MDQFTVYRNKNPRTKSVFPLLLDVQTGNWRPSPNPPLDRRSPTLQKIETPSLPHWIFC